MNKVYANMTSLGLLQIANFLIPLLIIPIITRVLGTAIFGQVSYAQNIVSYLTLVVNYGFEYSATHQIAVAHDDKEQQRIFWSVVYSKIALLFVSAIILLILILSVERIGVDWRLYFYTALINIGFVFFPTWYLQGIQDMQKMAWINFVIKALGALLVITLIHRAEQYHLYPLILSLSSIVVGIGAFIYVVKHYKIDLVPIDATTLKQTLAPGGVIFLNQVFVSLYTTVNFTLLGLYLSDGDLGIFSGAQRIILAANACVVLPVSTAIFPEMSRLYADNKEQAKALFRRVLIVAGAVSAFVGGIIWILAPWIVRILLGTDFTASVSPLRMMAIIPCLVMVATILTVQGLYGRGLQRYAPYIGAILAALCIGLNFILIPRIGMNGAIWAWIAAEICEIVLVSSILYQKRTCFT